MKGTIRISAPYVQQTDSDIFGPAVRLVADVEMDNPNTGKHETRPLWFEFERRFEEYLCPESSDAFVMALISSALENDFDIEFTAPMSETLFYHLNDEWIPALAKYYKNFPVYRINLKGPVSSQDYLPKGKGVAVGCSGGVDSFATIRAKLHTSVERFNITHLFMSSNGTFDNNEERMKYPYIKYYKHTKEISDFLGIDTIGCWNNIYSFYKFPYVAFSYFFASTFASSAYAVQKLIGIYHHNSGYSFEVVDGSKNDFLPLGKYDGSFMDLFALPRMSSEHMITYVSGFDKTRMEKEELIADFEAAHKFLTVCNVESGGADPMKTYNCSKCPKCLRTMSGFYALGKLENFREVFDIEDYKKNLGRRLGKWFAFEHGGFVRDFKRVAKQNGVKIPLSAYLWQYMLFGPWHFLREHLRNVKFIRRIYFRLGLDKKIQGYRYWSVEQELEKDTPEKK